MELYRGVHNAERQITEMPDEFSVRLIGLGLSLASLGSGAHSLVFVINFLTSVVNAIGNCSPSNHWFCGKWAEFKSRFTWCPSRTELKFVKRRESSSRTHYASRKCLQVVPVQQETGFPLFSSHKKFPNFSNASVISPEFYPKAQKCKLSLFMTSNKVTISNINCMETTEVY